MAPFEGTWVLYICQVVKKRKIIGQKLTYLANKNVQITLCDASPQLLAPNNGAKVGINWLLSWSLKWKFLPIGCNPLAGNNETPTLQFQSGHWWGIERLMIMTQKNVKTLSHENNKVTLSHGSHLKLNNYISSSN